MLEATDKSCNRWIKFSPQRALLTLEALVLYRAAAVARAFLLPALKGLRSNGHSGSKVPSLKIESHTYQPDEGWNLYQRSDHGCKRSTGVDSEYRHSHRDRQFEIIARCGK